MTTQLTELRLADIEPDPGQPRVRFDQQAIDELARSMRAEGLLQPITVRKATTGYRIIAGERRYRAATQLGWLNITAIVHDTDEDKARRLQLLENIVRRDLNPVEEARGIDVALRSGMSKHEVADALGKPIQFVTMAVDMLQACDDVLHLVERGQLSGLAAYQMARLDYNRQQQVLRLLATEKLTFHDLAALCERLNGEQNQGMMLSGMQEDTPAIKSAKRTFGNALTAASAALRRMHAIENKNPGTLAHVMDNTQIAQLDTLISELNRMKRAIRQGTIARRFDQERKAAQ